MREILFRGQTRRKGEYTVNMAGDKCKSNWVYGGIFPQNKDGDFAIIYQQEPEIRKFSVYADTVGQYTGLTDKNGVKIFEGDILAARFDEDFPENITIVQVVWNEYGWCIKQGSLVPDPLEDSDGDLFEVIGNIHDNPELLKGGEDNG